MNQTRHASACSLRIERGLTIVELLVAMVLLGIALAMVVSGVLQGLSSATGSRTGQVSDAALARVSDALNDDVAKAVTEDREANKLRDNVEMSVAVRTFTTAYSSNPDSPGAIDIDDVRFATATSFRVVADTKESAARECITWRVVQPVTVDGVPSMQIERLVDSVAACANVATPTGALSRKTMLTAALAMPGLDTTPFSYELLCNHNGGTCPGKPASKMTASSPGCSPWTADSGVAATQQRWIIAVNAKLVASSIHRKEIATTAGKVTVPIRSRDNFEYRRALGC